MSTKVLCVTVVVLALSSGLLHASVVNSKWVAGAWGQWETASNWDPPIVPDNSAISTFVVTIDGGTGKAEVTLGYGHTIDSILCYGVVHLTPVLQWAPVRLTLVAPSGLTNYGEVQTTGWSIRLIEIGGNVTNTPGATLDFWGGRIVGDLANPSGGSVQINGSVSAVNVTNDGYVSIVGGERNVNIHQKLTNHGRIHIGGGTYGCDSLADNDASEISGFGVGYCQSSWVNKGRIRATGGSLCLATLGSVSNRGTLANDPLATMSIRYWGRELPPDANNTGTIEVNAGGGVAFDCNLVNEPNAVVGLLGGTLAAKTITQRAGAILQGFGGITSSVVIEPKGVIKLTGPTNIVGDVTIGDGATLDVSDGTVLITGLTTCNGGTIRTKNGTVITQGGTSGGICRREFLSPVEP